MSWSPRAASPTLKPPRASGVTALALTQVRQDGALSPVTQRFRSLTGAETKRGFLRDSCSGLGSAGAGARNTAARTLSDGPGPDPEPGGKCFPCAQQAGGSDLAPDFSHGACQGLNLHTVRGREAMVSGGARPPTGLSARGPQLRSPGSRRFEGSQKTSRQEDRPPGCVPSGCPRGADGPPRVPRRRQGASPPLSSERGCAGLVCESVPGRDRQLGGTYCPASSPGDFRFLYKQPHLRETAH